MPIIETLSGILSNVLGDVLSALVPVIEGVAEVLTGVLGAAFDALSPIIDAVVQIFGGLIDFIGGVFSGNWEQAWNGIVEMFRGILNYIPAIVEGVINGAIGLINSLISGINSFTGVVGIPAIPMIPKVTLPRFHAGGIVDFESNDEGQALLKSGEMVLTERQQAELFAIANGAIPKEISGANEITANITLTGNVEMDGFKVGKVVLRNLDDVSAFTLRG
jgi:hypothetical protein